MTMPYIPDESKNNLMKTGHIRNAGELNFIFTEMLQAYIEDKGESYQTYNDIMGALMGAMLELYRRRIGQYEDKKIAENGDVYD